MKVGVLFSGGKDSCYAMYKAIEDNKVECLVSMKSKNPDSYMFHRPNIELAIKQAEAMQIPLIMQETEGEKEKELKDMKKAIEKAIEKYEIEGLVSGAIASSYQKKRVDNICKDLGIESIAPLWGYNQEKLMHDIIDDGFEFIITKIAAFGLDQSWLGKKIDESDIEKLMDINKRIGINVAFEGGEAETMMVDGPTFEKKVIVEDAEKIIDSECTGIYKIEKIRLVDKT